MNKLSDTGLTFHVNGTDRILKVLPVCCCVDSAARGPMQGLLLYNAYFGFNWCLHPGKYIKSKGKGGCVKFVNFEKDPIPRTAAQTFTLMQETTKRGISILVVKRPSSLLLLNNFILWKGSFRTVCTAFV